MPRLDPAYLWKLTERSTHSLRYIVMGMPRGKQQEWRDHNVPGPGVEQTGNASWNRWLAELQKTGLDCNRTEFISHPPANGKILGDAPRIACAVTNQQDAAVARSGNASRRQVYRRLRTPGIGCGVGLSSINCHACGTDWLWVETPGRRPYRLSVCTRRQFPQRGTL